MATKKRPDFGSFAKRTVNRPASMDDFLKDDSDVVEPKPSESMTQEKPESARQSKVSQNPKPATPTTDDAKWATPSEISEGQGAITDQSQEIKDDLLIDSLTFQTTVMFNPEIFENLEMLWMKLKKKAPLGKKKKFSKSLIINVMLAEALKDIETSDSLDHQLVTAIMQEIEG